MLIPFGDVYNNNNNNNNNAKVCSVYCFKWMGDSFKVLMNLKPVIRQARISFFLGTLHPLTLSNAMHVGPQTTWARGNHPYTSVPLIRIRPKKMCDPLSFWMI
jgi:hypothetical protein